MKQQRSELRRDPVLQMVREQRGTASRIAKACGINREAVWNWEARGEVPGKYVLIVESLLNIPRHRIRPDLYPPPYEYKTRKWINTGLAQKKARDNGRKHQHGA